MNFCKRMGLLALSTGLIFSQPVFAKRYKIDSSHSNISFKIRHLISHVRGDFKQFEGKIDFTSGKPKTWKVQTWIRAESINTNHKKRDEHLRSADFFDVKKYPEIAFQSTKFVQKSKKKIDVHGNLTIHGVTRPVILNVELLGEAKDPWGNLRRGFSGKTKINRKDFKINWNKSLDKGGVLLGDDVEIILDIEAIAEK